MDQTQKVIVDTFRETINGMLTEWVRLFGARDNVHWALSKVIVELDEVVTEYKEWSWAKEELVDGKPVRWKNWSRNSYLVLKDGLYFNRISLLDGKEVNMGRYTLSAQKCVEDGWTSWEPTE